MTKTFFLLTTGLLAAAGLAFAGAASADEAPLAVPAEVAGAADAFGGAETIDMNELADLSGGDGVEIDMLTDQTLTAINSGNSVRGDVVGSGNITFDRNALEGFEGIGNFVINTGHNNNLQSSLNVTVVLAP